MWCTWLPFSQVTASPPVPFSSLGAYPRPQSASRCISKIYLWPVNIHFILNHSVLYAKKYSIEFDFGWGERYRTSDWDFCYVLQQSEKGIQSLLWGSTHRAYRCEFKMLGCVCSWTPSIDFLNLIPTRDLYLVDQLLFCFSFANSARGFSVPAECFGAGSTAQAAGMIFCC